MKKKKTATNKATEKSGSTESQALSFANAGKYKEAINLYKRLVNESDSPEWHKQLAHCYIQRAMSFATKGMLKEAVVLWENHQPHSQPPYDAYEQYIIWLIQTNRQNKAQQCFSQLTAEQLDKSYPVLASVLGFFILSKHPEFITDLPQDSVFISQLKTVQSALQALQENNLPAVEKNLKQLPFRSAFKEFRFILSAVSAIPSSIEKAQSLLNKIPSSSIYYQSAQLLLSCFLNGSELTETLLTFSQQQRSLVAEIKGLNKKQLDFVTHYCRQHKNLSDKIKFNLAIKNQSLFSEELAHQICYALLSDYPAGKKEFNKHFDTVSRFEENRIKALKADQSGNNYDAPYYWEQCVSALEDEETDNDLKIALILRYLASKQADEAERVDLLERSLELDKSDRDCYLQVILYYSHQADMTQELKLWLDKALEQFPQDIEILSTAVKTAIANKTYNKACQFAAKILKIDPLNTFAKQTLFNSHLAHAQLLMRNKKNTLVEKEIIQAEKLNIGKNYNQQTQLTRALFCFTSKNKQQGLQDIIEAISCLYNDPINMHFKASIEALLTGLPVATILRELPKTKASLLSALELSTLIKQLSHYASPDNREYLHKALEKIKAPLKKSLSTQDYDESLLISFCKTLDTIQHFELLRHCTKSASLKINSPIWTYYRVYASNNGIAEACSYLDADRLQFAFEEAKENKDHQAEVLIERFLDAYYESHPQRGFGFLEELFGAINEDDNFEDVDPFDTLFGHLPKDIFITLDHETESLMKKFTPEKLIKEIISHTGADESILMALMQNPDIFSALLFVKAAEKLDTPIGVNIDDILKAFNITKKNKSSPFPF